MWWFVGGGEFGSSRRRYARHVLEDDDKPVRSKSIFEKVSEPEIIFYSWDFVDILPHNNDHVVIIVWGDKWDIKRDHISSVDNVDLGARMYNYFPMFAGFNDDVFCQIKWCEFFINKEEMIIKVFYQDPNDLVISICKARWNTKGQAMFGEVSGNLLPRNRWWRCLSKKLYKFSSIKESSYGWSVKYMMN